MEGANKKPFDRKDRRVCDEAGSEVIAQIRPWHVPARASVLGRSQLHDLRFNAARKRSHLPYTGESCSGRSLPADSQNANALRKGGRCRFMEPLAVTYSHMA